MYQPTDLMNLLVSGRGLDIDLSIPYGAGPRHTLDIYRPKDATQAPIIVFFYGGAWQSGTKSLYRFAATALARLGFFIVVPDYRIYPDALYPAFLRDAAQAIAWVTSHSGDYGGDATRLFVMGHSAGAYIASMIALDGRWLGNVGIDPQQAVSGFIGLAGPYDFLPVRDETLKKIFPDYDMSTQPVAHVRPGSPRALLATGQRDLVVDPANTFALADRLLSVGSAVRVVRYAHTGHFGIMAALAPYLRFIAPVVDDTVEFIGASVRSPGLEAAL